MPYAPRPFLYLESPEGYFNMKPDDDDYCTIDEAALTRAGIPLKLCNSVAHAKKQNLPGWEEAETYLIQLRVAIAEGIIQPVIPEFINNDPCIALICSGTEYVSRDILNNWPEVDYPENLNKKRIEKSGINTKTENTYKKLIASLLNLVMLYEGKQPKPTEFKNRNILKKDGTFSFNALGELLQAIDPDTPDKTDEFMRKSLNQD